MSQVMILSDYHSDLCGICYSFPFLTDKILTVTLKVSGQLYPDASVDNVGAIVVNVSKSSLK